MLYKSIFFKIILISDLKLNDRIYDLDTVKCAQNNIRMTQFTKQLD